MKPFLLSFLSVLAISTAFAQRDTPDELPTSKGPLTIQPLVHATMVLTLKNLTIYVDPTGGAANYTGIKPPDLIFITDIHGDHMDPATLSAVRTSSTILVMPKAVADKLPGDLKAKAVILNNGETTTQAGITITAIPMYNLPESPTAMHTKGRGNGYVLGIGGKNIYISGDTQGIPEMRALKNIDVAFVCMNLPYTMDVNEAADAVLAFKPKEVYPYHYRGKDGFSDVKAFKAKVEAGNKNIKVILKNWYPAK
ncbi:MBL fold metallo-hydrolase [Puia dinghuensis]|uniref:Metal-dependent hydrolase n=1 Tax=Puia dinghuensis TaxID=1792502 RepID=A0A8J2XST3_9BACT|nr:MBL fold metallo-hydrolase [Puia dinghuensis]GGA98499.1 metal-dependent hydrolase [Puia dinghuensis]